MIPAYCAVDEGLKRGDKGDRVTLLQMWMSLHGKRIAIDGDFGPATERALYIGWNTKVVTSSVAQALERPMQAVVDAQGTTLEVALKFVDWQAREVGGQNRGPWVRLVAKGKEGQPIKWCLFLQQWIAEHAGHPWAPRISADCDVTAAHALADRRLYDGGELVKPTAGDLFLAWRPDASKATGRDYYHGGLVTSSTASTFDTIEGNSNDEGSSDGHEVCERTRSLTTRYAFVRMSP